MTSELLKFVAVRKDSFSYFTGASEADNIELNCVCYLELKHCTMNISIQIITLMY